MRTIHVLILVLIPFINLNAQEVDSIIDIRDGQVYKIVNINDQWWMQENLNIDSPLNSKIDSKNSSAFE